MLLTITSFDTKSIDAIKARVGKRENLPCRLAKCAPDTLKSIKGFPADLAAKSGLFLLIALLGARQEKPRPFDCYGDNNAIVEHYKSVKVTNFRPSKATRVPAILFNRGEANGFRTMNREAHVKTWLIGLGPYKVNVGIDTGTKWLWGMKLLGTNYGDTATTLGS